MKNTFRNEVDANYEAFLSILPTVLQTQNNKFALLKGGKVMGFYSSLEDAYVTANQFFGDEPYSVQKVTTTPVDLGFFSHAVFVR
jgi:hypothetical protein